MTGSAPTVVLFDDERSFADGFRDGHILVRTVGQAERLFSELREQQRPIDELWLDFVLSPGDTTEAFHALEGVEVRKIIFHSTAFGARELVEIKLRRVGITLELDWPEDYPGAFQRR